MEIVSITEMYNRDIITWIQIGNNNKTKSKFQSEDLEGLGESGIKIIEQKKYKMSATGKVMERRDSRAPMKCTKVHTMLMLNKESP